jgi:hypothetical protein
MATSADTGTVTDAARRADVGAVAPADAACPATIWGLLDEFRDSPLMTEYLTRLTNNRDMHVIVTAAAETGVGKTTLAYALAVLWDMWGWTADKATLSPSEYEVKYKDVRPGSVLLLDEVEQAVDKRRATSSANVDLSQAFATLRYRQVFGLMTAPSKNWVDDRIGADSADYWIQAQETHDGKPKGEANVYRILENEHAGQTYTKLVEVISWPNLDWNANFRHLEALKSERMEGETERKYVHRDEVEDLKANYWNKCSQKARFHLVRGMSDRGLTQKEIVSVLDAAESDSDGDIESVSRQWVSELTRAESFEEVYSS